MVIRNVLFRLEMWKAEWVRGWWLLWPHRFDVWRGTANCGRCGVHWNAHEYTEKD